MKHYYTAMVIFAALASGKVVADEVTAATPPKPEVSIVTADATGGSQTTIVDQNGNLKVAPKDEIQPTIQPTSPPPMEHTVAPSSSMPTSSTDVRPMPTPGDKKGY